MFEQFRKAAAYFSTATKSADKAQDPPGKPQTEATSLPSDALLVQGNGNLGQRMSLCTSFQGNLLGAATALACLDTSGTLLLAVTHTPKGQIQAGALAHHLLASILSGYKCNLEALALPTVKGSQKLWGDIMSSCYTKTQASFRVGGGGVAEEGGAYTLEPVSVVTAVITANAIVLSFVGTCQGFLLHEETKEEEQATKAEGSHSDRELKRLAGDESGEVMIHSDSVSGSSSGEDRGVDKVPPLRASKLSLGWRPPLFAHDTEAVGVEGEPYTVLLPRRKSHRALVLMTPHVAHKLSREELLEIAGAQALGEDAAQTLVDKVQMKEGMDNSGRRPMAVAVVHLTKF